MARVFKGSHSFTCTPTRSSAIGMSHTCLLPPQQWLVLIYRPRRDVRLSRPRCEVAPAQIRTCNLPIANPALYHTATSASATEHHRPLAGTKLHCLVSKKHGCEQPAQSCFTANGSWSWTQQPLDCPARCAIMLPHVRSVCGVVISAN